jgi:hypothetical protein
VLLLRLKVKPMWLIVLGAAVGIGGHVLLNLW